MATIVMYKKQNPYNFRQVLQKGYETKTKRLPANIS